MNLEKLTDRAKGFLQAAQTIALREGHQQFSPEHLLKALLDDEQGSAAGLIDRAGGKSAAFNGAWPNCNYRQPPWGGRRSWRQLGCAG